MDVWNPFHAKGLIRTPQNCNFTEVSDAQRPFRVKGLCFVAVRRPCPSPKREEKEERERERICRCQGKRSRSADVRVRDLDLQMCRWEDVDLQMWGWEDVDLQMWGWEDLDLQMYDKMYYKGCFFTKNPSQALSGKRKKGIQKRLINRNETAERRIRIKVLASSK